jgi:hypothetical protein
MIPGPGQAGHDAALAATVARYDRFHEAVGIAATGLAASLNVSSDLAMRQKLDALLGGPWAATDDDPTDDLLQYQGLDPKNLVTSWGLSTGMYAGAEMAADAFRYAVLRDRGGSCNDQARARKVLLVALDAFHVAVAITGQSGSLARAIARKGLAGDGMAAVVPLADAAGKPLPAEKDNGTWRADNSPGGQFATHIWIDSLSRDMLFGWTLGIASIWEVIKNDATFPAAVKTRLQAEARAILDGLRVVRPSGKDLEIWDPDGRRTFHGNLHETSVDRAYVVKNGVASMMALGEVAGLVSIVDDASARGYLDSLLGSRNLPGAISQSMSVISLGGDQTNHSAFNMLFMTTWMAARYVPAPAVRSGLVGPAVGVYAPLFGDKPIEWKQSLFDLVIAASKGGAWSGGNASTSYDAAATARAVETLKGFPEAPFYALGKENCDSAEVASGTCTLLDGVTSVTLRLVDGNVVANKPIPMKLRPPSNYYWRSNPFLVNGAGDPNAVFPGSDLRLAYWLGRYVRVGN